ncbi:hypothetical protein [Fodinibius alkaliphilus]|uniref:hypothetical protein n=1 Tax=Fodinibius TaxID=1397106 RepID=UPI00315A8BD8
MNKEDSNNKTDQKQEQEVSEDDLEKASLFQEADNIKGKQLDISPDGDLIKVDEINTAVENIDDPEKKHDIYYKGIQSLLIEHLPSGDYYKEMRDTIYEEKNILLTRGHKLDENGIRGADSRMGYLEDMKMVLSIVAEWITQNGSPQEIYDKFREKNIELGYHENTED